MKMTLKIKKIAHIGGNLEIIGKIIGNKEGRIVVATLDLKIYELDRFAVIKRLFDDVCLFNVPDKEEKKD